MKLLPLLVALSLGLAAAIPAAQASTLIGGAWDTPLTFPQGDDAIVTQSGREASTASVSGN